MSHLLTDQSERVLRLATEAAERFNHDYVGTEHVLLALLKEGSGVVANVLSGLGVDRDVVREHAERIVQAELAGEGVVKGRPRRSPRAVRAIDYAAEEARNLGHACVGAEHLLLGLIRVWEGVGAQVLITLGVRLDDAREQVHRECKKWWQV